VSEPLTQQQVVSIRLGTPLARVLARFGPPLSKRPQAMAGDRCLFWRIADQPPRYLWRLCFRAGRLHIVATYIT
jgi:hypothetical protein